MRADRRLFYSCLMVLCIQVSTTWAQRDTVRVLFVGNSYTYFWNLPQTVQAMGQASGNTFVLARQSTAGGVTWKQHWEGDKQLNSRELIENGSWDYVVLQNHSTSTIDNPDQFDSYGEKFIRLIRAQQAEPLLYMTWAREYNPLMQSTIAGEYKKLGEQHAVKIVPVGEIWAEVRNLRPDLKLYDPDGSHPSIAGTYLTAAAFFSFFTGESATALPERIKTTDDNQQPLYLSIMSEEDASFMQEVVDTFFKGKE